MDFILLCVTIYTVTFDGGNIMSELKENTKLYKFWGIIMSGMAILSIVLVVLDFTSILSLSANPYKTIDLCILIIFTLDYFLRLFYAPKKLQFIKYNIFDLIAIIPFNSIFSFFRIARLFRVAKITRVTKIFRFVKLIAFFNILKKRLSDFLKTNGFVYVLGCSVVLILISSFIMTIAEKQSFSDALWWSIVTCTTVGYGDISPSTSIGRIIAVLLMIFGIGTIGMLTGTITTYFTRNRNVSEINISDDKRNKKVLQAYINHPEMQSAVDKLLGIEKDE